MNCYKEHEKIPKYLWDRLPSGLIQEQVHISSTLAIRTSAPQAVARQHERGVCSKVFGQIENLAYYRQCAVLREKTARLLLESLKELEELVC